MSEAISSLFAGKVCQGGILFLLIDHLASWNYNFRVHRLFFLQRAKSSGYTQILADSFYSFKILYSAIFRVSFFFK